MKIQVGDLVIGEKEKDAIMAILQTGRISEGKEVRKFEKTWASFVGTKYSILLNSGTSAIIAGLLSLRYHEKYYVNPGSKVVTSPLTYIATTNSIINSGLDPVFVDVDIDTYSITPEKVLEYLETKGKKENIRIILPVHLMGYPCDMDQLNKIARKYGLITFEDSAQAHGTKTLKGKTGSLSLLSDFSFYIAHNIQAGELGAINTNDKRIIQLIKQIKGNGRVCDCLLCTRHEGKCPKLKDKNGILAQDPRFTHNIIGYNFKTMEFSAAIANTQLLKADWILNRRRENVKYLNDGLTKISDYITLPKYDLNVSYLAYPLIIKSKRITREKMCLKLETRGIETRPLFGCIPTQQPAYSYLKKEYLGKLPNAEYLGKNGFYIGCHQYLEQKDLDFVIKNISNLVKELTK